MYRLKDWLGNDLPNSIVCQIVPIVNRDYIHQFSVLNTALIRDSLMAGRAERLAEACTREPWLVNMEVGKWFD